MKKIWVSCLLLLMIGALKSQNNFFPVDGITPGKTTVSEVKSRGYKFEKNRYFYIMSHFFYDFDGDNILEYFYTESGHVMPFLWVENFGFNWNLSYSDWMDILKKAGFVIKVNKEPQTRNWQGRNTLEARFTAFSPSGYTKFEFNFSYGNDRGEGYSISAPKSLYSISVTAYGLENSIKPDWDLITEIKAIVEAKVNQWQQKGEYEKSTDYRIRVNGDNRTRKVEEIQNETVKQFKDAHIKALNYADVELGSYDADNESYLLSSRATGEFVVSVPIADADLFKQNFGSLEYKNPDFIIKDRKFKVSHIELIAKKGKKYIYNIGNQANYSQTKIDYNFAPINVDVEDKSVTSTNGVQKPVNTITVGKSDVDTDIPVGGGVNDKTFAVVIGNEQYNNEIKVEYALNDARIFKEYLQKTLGLPANNINYKENATFGTILDALKWANDITKVYKGEAKLIFYYAGHGMPDEQTKSAYILPVDGNSKNIATSVRLADIYSKLTEHSSKSVTVFLDACFSGATREASEAMLAEGRSVKIKPKNEPLAGKAVVLSATTGEETALPYAEKQHGLFTYFLLKKLKETKGNTTLSELSSYIISNVSRQSVVVNRKSQTPQVNYSAGAADVWSGWSVK